MLCETSGNLQRFSSNYPLLFNRLTALQSCGWTEDIQFEQLSLFHLCLSGLGTITTYSTRESEEALRNCKNQDSSWMRRPLHSACHQTLSLYYTRAIQIFAAPSHLTPSSSHANASRIDMQQHTSIKGHWLPSQSTFCLRSCDKPPPRKVDSCELRLSQVLVKHFA